MWYHFMDMSSGGYQKTKYKHIFIKADSEDEAVEIFEQRLGTHPFSVACSCCGENFSCFSDKNIRNLADFWIKLSGMAIHDFYNAALIIE